MGIVRTRIKNSLKRLPYPALMRLYYAHYSLFYTLPKVYAKHRMGLSTATYSAMRDRKTSDTVFVLGSGSSINAISEDRWQAIRRHDSFGFNFWLLHDHVPTFYTFESPNFDDASGVARKVGETFARAAAQREQDYRNVFCLLTDLTAERFPFWHLLPRDFRKRLFTVQTLPVLARSRDELEASIRFLKAHGLFDQGAVDPVLKYRGTVSMVVALAAKLGYRNIVLCGIDLSDPAYFYQDPVRYPATVNLWSHAKAVSPVHPSVVGLPMLRPIDEILVVLQDMVLAPMGAQLYVENRSSALYPRIPLAPDDLFHDEKLKLQSDRAPNR